jgi:hypothetical protein
VADGVFAYVNKARTGFHIVVLSLDFGIYWRMLALYEV